MGRSLSLMAVVLGTAIFCYSFQVCSKLLRALLEMWICCSFWLGFIKNVHTRTDRTPKTIDIFSLKLYCIFQRQVEKTFICGRQRNHVVSSWCFARPPLFLPETCRNVSCDHCCTKPRDVFTKKHEITAITRNIPIHCWKLQAQVIAASESAATPAVDTDRKQAANFSGHSEQANRYSNQDQHSNSDSHLRRELFPLSCTEGQSMTVAAPSAPLIEGCYSANSTHGGVPGIAGQALFTSTEGANPTNAGHGIFLLVSSGTLNDKRDVSTGHMILGTSFSSMFDTTALFFVAVFGLESYRTTLAGSKQLELKVSPNTPSRWIQVPPESTSGSFLGLSWDLPRSWTLFFVYPAVVVYRCSSSSSTLNGACR